MPQKSETRAVARASGMSLISIRDFVIPLSLQARFLIAAHHVRPELAAMVAALAFGGGGYHG